jgi:hypothetical protein
VVERGGPFSLNLGGGRNTYTVFVGKLKGDVHSELPGVGGRKILKWILGK